MSDEELTVTVVIVCDMSVPHWTAAGVKNKGQLPQLGTLTVISHGPFLPARKELTFINVLPLSSLELSSSYPQAVPSQNATTAPLSPNIGLFLAEETVKAIGINLENFYLPEERFDPGHFGILFLPHPPFNSRHAPPLSNGIKLTVVDSILFEQALAKQKRPLKQPSRYPPFRLPRRQSFVENAKGVAERVGEGAPKKWVVIAFSNCIENILACITMGALHLVSFLIPNGSATPPPSHHSLISCKA
ncbi:hypothetical protein CEXT_23501 [Caerostris extrusa]|uniref:Uncharacterized protein n=1 Tax=Caerostris extrusa TaxID=172846 RepID=A0AAV4P9Z7_CAEEX|nr:hypothetical protein CEXT_23501 [Caerostris extrusa]